ncbi:pleiotropic drug resistance protein 3-like [Gossypium australe]|uniref:Pleiotropic drug resistance protein 3-like n=1 Tax=Gossypium australe TaxID=47621 RepID=A0A5B6VXR1_9ROSI|nr:pleiotropic drug resistance protein 3-like [Gossypium australe]
MACDTPKQAWDRLKEEFQGSDKTRQQQLINLRRDFENLKMKKFETIKQYADRTTATINNIRLLGDEFSDKRIPEKVITTLPKKYESKISSLEESRNLSAIPLTELINALYAQKQRRANRMEEHSEGAFQARSRESSSSSSSYKGKKPWLEKKEKGKKDAAKRKFSPCTHYKKSTHLEKYCWYRPNIQCKSCKQLGHIENNQAQTAEDVQTQEEHVFTASCFANSSKVRKNWLIGSGCTHHMASGKGMFRELNTNFVSKVRIGNGEFIEAKGKGKALLEKGYSLIFEEKTCVIKDSFNQVLVTIAMYDRSFILDVNQLKAKVHTTLANESYLWHKRLRHVNYKSLSLLHKMNLVEDMSKIEPRKDVCEVCQFGNLKSSRRAPTGPYRHLWTYEDLFFERQHVSFLKQNSEVTDYFCKFKLLAENQASCKLKILRFDNGTEYKICDEAGIQHQLTTIYSPQQNGVCERKNMTVLDMAKCLLFEGKVPNNFWAKAVNTSVYLLNRLPTNAVKGKTPFEAWFRHKPNVSHLKVFGCLCYTLVPAKKRIKLEKRSMPGVFVGYSSVKKGYMVFNPSTKKIVVSRDVKFNEGSCWKWDGTDANLSEQDQHDLDLQHAEIEAETEDDYDDAPVRGTRTLMDIYERCDMTIVEPSNFNEAAREGCWKEAMKVELRMIHKK